MAQDNGAEDAAPAAAAAGDTAAARSLDADGDGLSSDGVLSKNQQRKQRRRERVVAARRAQRHDEKRRRRARDAAAQAARASAGLPITSKRDRRRDELERLQAARADGLPVCLDLQYAAAMTEKQQTRLCGQLARVYGANRRAERPVRLVLTHLPEESQLHQLCCRRIAGFPQLQLERQPAGPAALFPPSRLVFLSPDAEEPLLQLLPDRVYVIGGLVDETVVGGLSRAAAERAGATAARLPLREYLRHDGGGATGCVLTVNQVFEVLLSVWAGRGWTEALAAAVPTRKGFVPRRWVAAAKPC